MTDTEKAPAMSALTAPVRAGETVRVSWPGGSDPCVALDRWLAELSAALQRGSAADLVPLFAAESTWRDFMALLWDFSHSIGRHSLVERLSELAKGAELGGLTRSRQQDPLVIEGAVHGFFDFVTSDRCNRGYVKLVDAGGRVAAEVLQTEVVGLQEHPELVGPRRPEGKVYDVVPGRTRWTDDRTRGAAFTSEEPAVLILGAGHNGLATAARLGALGVPTLVIERERRVGDTWRKRYEALALHSTVWGDHLPYLPLPPTWTSHTPKDKFADWLECYATLLDLNVWTSATFVSGAFDDDAQRWDIRVQRGDGSVRELHPRHFIVAGGLFGSPKTPQIPGLDMFDGVSVHSDAFRSGSDFTGRRVLVVGAGVSGHEIAQDLFEHGAEVTMLQRGATYVISHAAYHKYWSSHFVEDPVFPPEFADQIAYATPNTVGDEVNKRLVRLAREEDKELLNRLEARGFQLEWGPDGTGIIGAHMSGRDSYQIDIGASRLIADGDVALKQGVEIREIRDGSVVVFTDDTEMEVDAIVFATGYEQHWNHMRPLLGPAAARIDKAYGRAADNEYANTWRRSAQPGLWFSTGFIRMARFYSRFTALLIKAIEEGIEPFDPDRPGSRGTEPAP